MDSSVNARPARWQRISFRVVLLLLITLGSLRMFGSQRPSNLGVSGGKLAACPASQNCVSTQAESGEQRIEPLHMVGDLDAVTTAAREAILSMPRAKLVTEDPHYCHIECTSLICRFVDDLEIWIDEENKLIHARSASRIGYSDLGVNRKRVEQVFTKLIEAGVADRT